MLEGRGSETAIARAAAPIEDHSGARDTRWEYVRGEDGYSIPYRCLLPAGLDGVLVAGRCFSASHDAHASARNMAQCMAMGQAAGTAAALAARSGCDPHEVEVEKLQGVLAEAGALIEAAQ